MGNQFNEVQKGLAWFMVVSFVTLIFVWVFKPPVMAAESMAQLNQLVSTLQNILLIAIGFFFGSSTREQKKDDQMIAAALAPPPSGPSAAPTLEQLAHAQLTAAEFAHFTTLPDDDAKKKFISMTPDERVAAIGKG